MLGASAVTKSESVFTRCSKGTMSLAGTRRWQGSKVGFRSIQGVVGNGPASIAPFPKDLCEYTVSFERDRCPLETLSSVPSLAGAVGSRKSLVWRRLVSRGTRSMASTHPGPVKPYGQSEEVPPLMTVKIGASSFSNVFLGRSRSCTIAEMRSTADIVLVSLLAGMAKEKTSRKMASLFVKAIR
jgi:hypothetical protein